MSNLAFVTLYDRQDLLKESMKFLNSEWPRSDGSREHSQKKSCRQMPPMSFLLLDKTTDAILGHSRVTRLPNREHALWIESVMIEKSQRGRGLGKILMEATEQWMVKNGFDEAFLSTEDQCGFYKLLGYENCEPIIHSTTATCVFAAMSHFQNNAASNHIMSSTPASPYSSSSVCTLNSAPPPPPPPPKMTTRSTLPIVSVKTIDHQYMKKRLKPTA